MLCPQRNSELCCLDHHGKGIFHGCRRIRCPAPQSSDSAFPLRRHNIAQRENVLSIRLQQETTMNTWTACLLLALGTAGAWWSAHAQSADSRYRQAATGHHLQRTPRSAATRHAFRQLYFPAWLCTSTASDFRAGIEKVMPHWHPDTVRTVLVMSGTFYFAVGEQWDESKLKAYPAGTLYSEPAKARQYRETPHFAWAKDGEVIFRLLRLDRLATPQFQQEQ